MSRIQSKIAQYTKNRKKMTNFSKVKDNHSKMTQMLELSDKNLKATIGHVL